MPMVSRPTPDAWRGKLTISALRVFSAMSALKIAVSTGLVMGTTAKTTPTGLASSAT